MGEFAGNYVGRFAPSPSGPMHMGSLVAALASYLQARVNNGRWLVRIEDLDPPREIAGAASTILSTLAAHHLHHDGAIVYQSQRHPLYAQALQKLRHENRLYACKCTRAELRAAAAITGHHRYPGTCRPAQHAETDSAIRLRLINACVHPFDDPVFGQQSEDLRQTTGDFVLRRRDGLFAYQLAVVVDDAEQGVNQVVRGADLLNNTARQIHLQRALGLEQPSYVHIPVLLDQHGQKLSKQNHAPALDSNRALQNLQNAWRSLGQAPLPTPKNCEHFLLQAAQNWHLSKTAELGA